MSQPTSMSSAEQPPEWDYDHLDRTHTHDEVWQAYADMRERCAVARNTRYGGHLHVLRYDDVRDTAGRAEDFLSGDGGFIPPSGLPRMAPIDYDGHEHKVWRALMQGPLTPAAIREFMPALNAVIEEHIDAFAQVGSVELFSALAEPLPAHVVGRLVGLATAECRMLRTLAIAAFQSIGTPEFNANKAALTGFIHDQVERRRRTPTQDFLTELSTGSVEGRPLDDEDITSVLTTLFIGGHHSTAAAMSALLYHVLSVPGLREVVTNGGSKLTALVEESLRLTTPLHIFARTASRDTAIGDLPVAAGTRLFVNYSSANHDPRRFVEPEEFRLDRTPNPHLAFGYGPHLCLGRHLARAELKAVLSRLFERLPDIALAGEVKYSTLQSGKLLEIEHIPVRFTPENQ
jgi:cholest-4-en-3-one 26-monooxygenase